MRAKQPELWARLREMDKKVKNDFRKDYSLDQLEIRFAFEDELESAGINLPKKEFFRQLYERFEAAGCAKKKAAEKNTMCDLKSATIASCDRVQK